MSRLNTSTGIRNSSTREKNKVISIKGVGKQNLPYLIAWIIFYVWISIYAIWWPSSSSIETIFKPEMRVISHSVILISAAFVAFIMRKEWFTKISQLGSVFIVIGMVLFYIAQNNILQMIAAIILAAALGCVLTGILISFVFALNNTEKILALVSSHFLSNLILFLLNFWGKGLSQGWAQVISFAFLALALGATFFFQGNSILPCSGMFDEDPAKIPHRIYFTLAFNCSIIILSKGVGHGLLHITGSATEMSILPWYHVGGVIGIILFIALYLVSRKAFLWLGNITFSTILLALFFNAFAPQFPILALAFAFVIGLGTMVGMINMLYIIGIVGKKYNSIKYLRIAILVVGTFGGLMGVALGNYISTVNSTEISFIASMFVALVMLLFLVVSPVFASINMENDWASDSLNMEIDKGPVSLFRQYKLSKREAEVCKLLLQGFTMRQISAMLSISYSTVNTYCTSIYRKLQINSRTELLLLFKDYLLQQ